MGAVYRVREERSDRVVALKRLYVHSERMRSQATSLFEREFYTLS